MNIQLKAKLQVAIQECIDANAEEDFWEGYIHPELTLQMVNAAESVFDSSMSGQQFAQQEAN